MKSSYELAMERLEKQAPSAKLSAAQKAEIADLDTTYKAKIAEQELFLKDKIQEVTATGKYDEVLLIEQQLTREIRRLNEECEAKKTKVREG